jgi:hypothetical protein
MFEPHDLLMSTVIAAAREQGYTCFPDGPNSVVLVGQSEPIYQSLTNLRRLTADEPHDRWPMLVADRLGTWVMAVELAREMPLDFSDFHVIGGLIRTRLYSTSTPAGDTVRRVAAPGLIQRVVLDHVHTMTPVTYEMLRDWPIDETELFDIAERNVHNDGPLELLTTEFDVPIAAGLPITMLHGSEYASAHAHWLGEYPVTGPAGALLIIPSQLYLYSYPITDLEVLRAMTVLAQMAVHGHAEKPWPVSPFVYRCHRGRLGLAASTIRTDNGISICPTKEFEDLLNGLGRALS